MTAIAAVAAALQYFAVTKGLARHTELDLSVRPLLVDREAQLATIEVSIVIANASLRNMTFRNVISCGEEAGSDGQGRRLWGLTDHISDRDEFIRLHANTKITLFYVQAIPLDLKLLKISVLVPYGSERIRIAEQLQMDQVWGNKDGEEYNGIERCFAGGDIYRDA